MANPSSISKNAGFTLSEVMITGAIIAILAVIAYPSYVQYVVKSNRSATQQFLLDVASRQEQYLVDTRRYTADLGAGGLNMTLPHKVNHLYTIAVAAPATIPPTYTITATPKSGSLQADDPVLSLNNIGVRLPADNW